MTKVIDGTKVNGRQPIAARFIRKMRGGSQSCLVQASDEHYYVVKLLGNPQGSAVLFNEAFGTQLMRETGLPVPKWCPIELSDEFIDRNPGLWFETGTSGQQRPHAGLHFGSRLVIPDDSENLYELLPRSWFGLIRNRADFIGVLLFDLWANHADNRQAIFIQNIVDRSVKAIFIDQGYLFGARNDRQPNAAKALYLDSLIYTNLDIDSTISMWEARFLSFDCEKIASVAASGTIPTQWYTPGNLDRIVSGMIERQSLLSAYSYRIKMYLRAPSSHKNLQDWNRRLDDIQSHGTQLCSQGHRRVGRSLSRVS